jgi:hypothetical protein
MQSLKFWTMGHWQPHVDRPPDFQFCAHQIFDQGPLAFHKNSNLFSPAAANSSGPAKFRTATITSSTSVCSASNRLRRRNAFHCADFPGELGFAIALPMAAAASPNRRLTPADVLSVMQRVADWQLAHPSVHPTTDWTQAAGDAGMMAMAGR